MGNRVMRGRVRGLVDPYDQGSGEAAHEARMMAYDNPVASMRGTGKTLPSKKRCRLKVRVRPPVVPFLRVTVMVLECPGAEHWVPMQCVPEMFKPKAFRFRVRTLVASEYYEQLEHGEKLHFVGEWESSRVAA